MLNYDGVEYNLSALIQWELLSKLLTSMIKKQNELNFMIKNGGTNINQNNINNNTETNYESLIERDYEPEIDLPDSYGKELKDKIKSIEKKLKNMNILEQWIKNLEKKTSNFTKLNDTVTDLKKDVESNKNEIQELNKKIEELNNKQFNLVTEVKEEKKEEEDEEEENIKINPQLVEKIQKLEKDNESYKKDILNLKNDIDSIKKDIEELKKNQNSQNENNKNELNNLISKFQNLEKSNTNIMSEIENLKAEKEKMKKEEKKEENQISKEQMNQILKLINDNKGSISNLERELQNLSSKTNTDKIQTQLDELLQNMELLVTKSDIIPIKEKITEHQNEIEILKESIQQQNEMIAKAKNDILNFSKKIESFSGMLLMLQSEAGTKSSSSTGGQSKGGVDPVVFSNAMKIINQQILYLQNDCNEFRRNFNEILPLLNKLSTVDDLRNLEEVLKALLEEYKLLAQRRFADKIDTQRNLKLLDTQMKHFMNEYIEKNQKGDNWMLASKPVGGYKCASCERYLGELTNKFEYLPWNKYPNRDFVDKPYRMGNGFSKMLQKLSLDVKKESDNVNNITIEDIENDEKRNTADDYKKKNVLPKVRVSTTEGNKMKVVNRETQMENEKLTESLKTKSIGFNEEAKLVKIKKISKKNE